ncbi:MAG: hypothetical protein R3C97_16755 [Geminicoccaceae bacterium]
MTIAAEPLADLLQPVMRQRQKQPASSLLSPRQVLRNSSTSGWMCGIRIVIRLSGSLMPARTPRGSRSTASAQQPARSRIDPHRPTRTSRRWQNSTVGSIVSLMDMLAYVA